MNPVKEVTIQEINLDPSKKYLISIQIEDDVPRDVVANIRWQIIRNLYDTCKIPNQNLVVLLFKTSIKDISIEEAKPIKTALEKLLEEKNKDEK